MTTTSAAVTVTVKLAVAQMYYIHPDHLNTPRLIADSTGRTVWRWDQGEPFGNDVPNNNPSGAGAFDFPLRFPGQYFDRETNLAYNAMRDYDPGIGRYVQSDLIGLSGGLNTFLYVNGNPILFADPTGLISPGGVGARAGEAIHGGISGKQKGDEFGKQLCASGLSNQGLWSDCTQKCLAVGEGSDFLVICTSACDDSYRKCKPKKPQSSCPAPSQS
jgi:RHS repeat-associated protein